MDHDAIHLGHASGLVSGGTVLAGGSLNILSGGVEVPWQSMMGVQRPETVPEKKEFADVKEYRQVRASVLKRNSLTGYLRDCFIAPQTTTISSSLIRAVAARKSD